MLNKIKKYIKLLLTIALIAIIVGFIILLKRNKALNKELEESYINIKAYNTELSDLKDSNIQFEFTIDQLNYLNDSIIREMRKVQKELKIKDKELRSLQYILSTAHRTDTIVTVDTIFKDSSINIDTIIGDQWYTNRLLLKYPNTIIVSPKFRSEKYINLFERKETIKPPKKIFFLRWFQKKHKVTYVDIYEKNPYIDEERQRFIEIK